MGTHGETWLNWRLEVDEKKAREILEGYLTKDDNLYYIYNYINWRSGASDIVLDGSFNANELEAMAWWIRNKN